MSNGVSIMHKSSLTSLLDRLLLQDTVTPIADTPHDLNSKRSVWREPFLMIGWSIFSVPLLLELAAHLEPFRAMGMLFRVEAISEWEGLDWKEMRRTDDSLVRVGLGIMRERNPIVSTEMNVRVGFLTQSGCRVQRTYESCLY